jgi:hypothetical protein
VFSDRHYLLPKGLTKEHFLFPFPPEKEKSFFPKIVGL